MKNGNSNFPFPGPKFWGWGPAGVWALLGLWLGQCSKPQQPVEALRATVPTRTEITALWMADSLQGWASAGTSWEVGYLLSTQDGGQTWQVDDTLRHKMECVMANPSGHAFAVGQSGICCERPPKSPAWTQYREDYVWHRSCFMPNGQTGIIVGGESFGKGQARVHGPEYFWQLDTLVDFANQIQAVWATDSLHYHACGLGWVIRSTDGGHTWTRAQETNDFFSDVHFPTPLTGYICGRTGTLLKTTDGGLHWETLRNGGNLKPKRQLFNAIWFASETEGWVVGEQGLVWHTTDGGAHWTTLTGLPDTDYQEVFAGFGKVWVCGHGGTIVYWDL